MRSLRHDLLPAGPPTLAPFGGIAYPGAADAGMNPDEIMIRHRTGRSGEG